MAVIVVYGGGFQPFHAGHLSSYLEAKEAFPNADFYVAASNDTKTRPIPFTDKQFLAQQAGVSDPFVQVKAPINPTEILDRYNPKKDIFILVRSERDPVGYTKKDGSPGYYQPFVSLDECKPFGYHGYVFVTHKKEFKLNRQVVYSGTQVRDMYAGSDDKGRINIIKQLYPQSAEQNSIKQMLDKYIGSSEPEIEPKKSAIKKLKADKLKEHIQRMRPLMSEASVEQKLKLLKLMKVALSEADGWMHMDSPSVAQTRNQMKVQGITGGPESTFSSMPASTSPSYSSSNIPKTSPFYTPPPAATPKDPNKYYPKYTPPDERDEYWVSTPMNKGGKIPPVQPKSYPNSADTEMNSTQSKDVEWFEPREQRSKKYWQQKEPWVPSTNKIRTENMAESEIDEAKIHFTDPSIKVNLYYIPPKLEREGKVQNVAHSIPYSTVQPLIDRLMQKYPNMKAEYLVVGPVGQDQYGERLREESDEEELTGNLRAVRQTDPEFGPAGYDYYHNDELVEPGTQKHSKIQDIHMLHKYPEYGALKKEFGNPTIKPGAAIPPEQWPENQPSIDRIVPDFSNPKGPDYLQPLDLDDEEYRARVIKTESTDYLEEK